MYHLTKHVSLRFSDFASSAACYISVSVIDIVQGGSGGEVSRCSISMQ